MTKNIENKEGFMEHCSFVFCSLLLHFFDFSFAKPVPQTAPQTLEKQGFGGCFCFGFVFFVFCIFCLLQPQQPKQKPKEPPPPQNKDKLNQTNTKTQNKTKTHFWTFDNQNRNVDHNLAPWRPPQKSKLMIYTFCEKL